MLHLYKESCLFFFFFLFISFLSFYSPNKLFLAKKKKMLGRSLLRNAAIVMPRMSATRYLSTSVVRKNAQDEEKAGFLKSVLYGNNEDALAPETGDATTHSKKLARGKYVHELQSKYPPSPFF
jgi:hypothetical protein